MTAKYFIVVFSEMRRSENILLTLHLYTVNADLSVFDFAATSLLDMTRTKSIRWLVEFALIGFYSHTLFNIIGLSYKLYPSCYVRLFLPCLL